MLHDKIERNKFICVRIVVDYGTSNDFKNWDFLIPLYYGTIAICRFDPTEHIQVLSAYNISHRTEASH